MITPTPVERSLPPAAQVTLDCSLQSLDRRINDYDRTLAEHGIDPGDSRLYAAAIRNKTQQLTSALVADRPNWLTALVGPAPTDAVGSQTWRDSVAMIARYQLRTGCADSIGERLENPSARAQWDDVVQAVVANRTWIATTDRCAELPAIMRSDVERYDRLIELDDILATAPPDTRQMVTQLCDGQLSFDDTAELLQAALAQRDARRHWIIEHWPHIVEYQELLDIEPSGAGTTLPYEPEMVIEL